MESATSQADHTQSSAGDQETMQGERALLDVTLFRPVHDDDVIIEDCCPEKQKAATGIRNRVDRTALP